MMPQSSLGVRLLGVLLMERYNAGRKELVSRKKKNNEVGFKHTEFFVPMGSLGRVFHVLEMHNISAGILSIVDVPGVVQLTVPSSSLCTTRQTLETDSAALIS